MPAWARSQMARSSSRKAVAKPSETMRVTKSGRAFASVPVNTRVAVGERGWTASQSHESRVTMPTKEGGTETSV